MIATGGEGKDGEKVNLKICLAGELNPDLQHEILDLSKMIWTQPKCIEPVQKLLVVKINNLDQSKTIVS